MQHKTEAFKASDGTQLFSQRWLPETPQAALVVSHGYAEHSQRYDAFARFLVEHGVAVYALDHRGHGRSEGERVNIKVFRQYVHDLSRYIEWVREHHPNPPRFLFGHSMGGVIAAQLALEHPLQVEGLILSAPHLQNAVNIPAPLLKVSGLVSRFLPGLPTLKLDTDLLSRDPAAVAAYRNDPLVYTGATKARLGKEMLDAGAYVLERAASVKLPLLILQGTDDGIAAAAGSQAFYNSAASKDKTLELYEGHYHELLNDVDKKRVYSDVLEWLKARLIYEQESESSAS